MYLPISNLLQMVPVIVLKLICLYGANPRYCHLQNGANPVTATFYMGNPQVSRLSSNKKQQMALIHFSLKNPLHSCINKIGVEVKKKTFTNNNGNNFIII